MDYHCILPGSLFNKNGMLKLLMMTN